MFTNIKFEINIIILIHILQNNMLMFTDIILSKFCHLSKF